MDMAVVAATLRGCAPSQFNDAHHMEQAIRAAVEAGGFTLIKFLVHTFSPQGITASAVLAESHIALHSWPEHGALFVDVATCSGKERTLAAFQSICQSFGHTHVDVIPNALT